MVEEDEIDLRPYIMAVLRHWKVVGGVTALFAAVAAAVGFTTPVTLVGKTFFTMKDVEPSLVHRPFHQTTVP